MEKQFIALSRAVFELRCGRAVSLAGWAFMPYEAVENIPETTVIAPPALHLPQKTKEPENEVQRTAIALLKRAGMLPAAVVVEATSATAFDVKEIQQALQQEPYALTEVARANLPIAVAENARIVSFRSFSGGAEHLAVLIGQPEDQRAPLVRVHSSCLTGDLLGSLRCDCGDQLHLALQQMAQAGHGVLCYLQQEGRGIGISNKIRAYALQDAGQDTLDANLALGFEADERDFGLAATMLKKLGISAITLLSNNPQKQQQLAQAGIEVVEQRGLSATPTAHNEGYLHTKATRFGHRFS